MEHILAEKRRNLLRYTPKPHSHALNDVIMHKTHSDVKAWPLSGSAGTLSFVYKSRDVVSTLFSTLCTLEVL